MKLSIAERVALLGVLPAEGNFVTLKIVRQLRESLSFSEEELKGWGIKLDGSRMTWNEEGVKSGERDISIGERATDLIVDGLKKLDETKKLTEQHFTLYEKFVDGETSKA